MLRKLITAGAIAALAAASASLSTPGHPAAAKYHNTPAVLAAYTAPAHPATKYHNGANQVTTAQVTCNLYLHWIFKPVSKAYPGGLMSADYYKITGKGCGGTQEQAWIDCRYGGPHGAFLNRRFFGNIVHLGTTRVRCASHWTPQWILEVALGGGERERTSPTSAWHYYTQVGT